MGCGKDTVIDSATTEGKKQEISKNMNAIAITNLTTAFTGESLIGVVYQERTTKRPSELAQMLVDAVFMRYVP